jgi:Tfp pilus assembly protein PilO
MRPGPSIEDQAKLLWFAGVLVVVAGFFFVFRVDESHIGERLADNARITGAIARDEQRIRARAALETERARLRAQITPLTIAADRTATVTTFVADLARTAASYHTIVVSIAAADPQPPGTPRATSSERQPRDPIDLTDAFERIPLDLTIEGRYGDILATIRALSSGRVLATVDVSSLSRKAPGSTDATLSAALHVVLHRLPPQRLSGAPARPA